MRLNGSRTCLEWLSAWAKAKTTPHSSCHIEELGGPRALSPQSPWCQRSGWKPFKELLGQDHGRRVPEWRSKRPAFLACSALLADGDLWCSQGRLRKDVYSGKQNFPVEKARSRFNHLQSGGWANTCGSQVMLCPGGLSPPTRLKWTAER